MTREEYADIESQYQAFRQELHKPIDEKYKKLKEQSDHRIQIELTRTKDNLALKQRIYGGIEKENRDTEKVNESKLQSRQLFFHTEQEKEKQKADDFAELQIFGKKWGRLQARETALGLNDAIVQELKKEKEIADIVIKQEQTKARENIRVTLNEPHSLELLKGKYKDHFNEKAK